MSGIPIASGFQLNSQLPIDTRFIFNTLAEANNLDINFRYLGLKTYIVTENTYYYLKDDINTFVPFNEGSSVAIVTEWTSGNNYAQYQLISYLGKLYKGINNISNSTLAPDIDTANFTVYGGSSGGSTSIKFPFFTPNYSYAYKECIIQNGLLYEAHQSFTSGSVFSFSNWDLVGGDMTKNVYDQNGNTIVENAEHANIADIALESELLQSWKPNTDYIAPNMLYYNSKTYEVTTNFTSGTIFDETNLKLISTGQHNELLNLQGGNIVNDEFYHLSKSVNDVVTQFNDDGTGLKYGTYIVGNMKKEVYDANMDGIIDKATTLDGLIATITELNMLNGLTGNVQAQINSLTSVGNFTGTSSTYANISTTYTTPHSKDMVIVLADENHSNASSIYIYNGTSWVYSGAFTATIRDFTTNPLDVTTESTGLYLEARIDSAIARKTDIPNLPNANLLATYTQLDSNISNAVTNSHTHANKSILDSYTQTNADLADAVNKKHSHVNETVLDKWSEDSNGNPLYNGNVIQGSGGSGVTDLSSFTTADLSDSMNRRYVTDQDRANLANLNNVVSSQSSMNNSLVTINGEIPSDASSTNKLVSNNTLTSQLNNLKFFNLSDVNKTVKPNAFVVVDSTGNTVTYLQSIKSLINIQKITDKNGILFTDVPYLKFNSLTATQDADGTLELNMGNLYTTNLQDMPQVYEDGKILVANASGMNYQLKDIGELTNSKANFSTVIQQIDWYLDTQLGLYTKTVQHNLNSTNLIIGTYDGFNNSINNISWAISDANNVIFKSPNNNSLKVVINCSQGTTGDGTGSGGSYVPTAGDFIDDTRVRSDKTYSSQKITDVLQTNYSQINNVYTKMQSDALYALKANEHIHTNMNVLNQLSADLNNNLIYNGQKILTNLQPFTYQDHWTNVAHSTLTLLVDVTAIFNTNNYNAILNSEINIKNDIPSIDTTTDAKPENQLRLVITDDTLVLLDVLIKPQSTQKYIIGISPNAKIQVQGNNISGNFYLTAY